MAIQTPAHIHRLIRLYHFHLVDPAMAFNAADAGINVGTMIKIGEFSEMMDIGPFDGTSIGIALPDRREFFTLGMNGLMAVHARFSRGDGSEVRLLDGIVAIPAIEAKLANVQSVAIGHRLRRGVTYTEGRRMNAIGQQHSSVHRHRGQTDQQA